MSWLKIDDQIAFHAKTVAAGNAAFGAWVRMTAWSCAQLTDGRIPGSIARTMATSRELRDLVSVGFLDPIDGGFEVHGFLDWNPRSEKILEKKSKDAARKAAGRANQERDNLGRVRGLNHREYDQMSARTSDGLQLDSERSPSRRPPVPSPSPSPSPSPDPEQQNPHNPPPAGPTPASRSVAVAPAMSGQQSGSEDAEQAEDAERRPATGPRTLFDCLDVGSEGSSVESPAKGPKRGKADGAKKSPRATTRAAVLRDRAADIATVLELWRTQPYHGRPPVITTARQVRVADRLLEGGTVEELCEAVRGVALSAYHLGQNDGQTKYVDIETILRDRGQVEKFGDLFRNGASRAAAVPTSYRAGIQPMAPPGEECWTPGDGKNWLEEDNA